jgi:3-isopropylmalate/(R)-2-methylmalate dehydratase small subunit
MNLGIKSKMEGSLMRGITIIKGKVAVLDRSNVDTDQIMPKQFLKRVEKTGFGEFVFYEWRYLKDGTLNPEFELNKYKEPSVLATGDNFGCGSSREHAVWGLKEYGFKAIIAPSFADIFYSNSIENMLLLCIVDEKDVRTIIHKAKENYEYSLTIDLPNQTIYDDFGFKTTFHIDKESKERLLKGWDSIDMVLQFEENIRKYEERRLSFFPSTKNSNAFIK